MFNRYKFRNPHLSGYNPRDVGRHSDEKEHSYGPAVRNYWLLHYVFDGSVTFQKGDKVYEVQKGECFFIRPNEVTVYKATAPWYYVWMGFSSENIPAFLKTTDVFDAHFLEPIFTELEANIDKYNSPLGENGVREAYLLGKISETMALIELHCGRPAKSKSEIEMEKIKNYIDARLSSDLHINEIAAEFHIDRAHLSRKFKEVFGLSPQNYIVSTRLKEAAKLMTTHGLSPTEAASAVGYSDIYLFSKMFKRLYGVSPRMYKNT